MIPKQAYKQLVLSMLALMIAMSISRFAYTPILPFMQQDTSMNNQNAGLLATFNYLGYLMGAIIPMFITIKSKVFDLKLYVMINVISVILMGFSEHFLIWSVLRIIAGITSGTIFVLASNVALEALRMANKQSISGILYSAVGIGIFSSSIFIFLYTQDQTWKATWIILGVVALMAGIIILTSMKDNPSISKHSTSSNQKQGKALNRAFIIPFSIAYFFEGAGYIVTGTFLVALIKTIPAYADYAALSWMFVGLGAMPATLIWSLFAEKIGYKKAIYSALILQIISVGLPIFSHHMLGLIIASMLFGATFLGLTTLFMSKSQELMYHTNQKLNLVSLLTVIYSVGQMLAPMIAGLLIGDSNNYQLALTFAMILLILGFIFSIISYRFNAYK
ncbi:YbfB/YjiJ family MFS transporter [Staphylococcus haemolyticus]|uniref:YbfB/YjiJ family MFS transporter n=1 Tax=Staphylococcus haemolyticus TaxID=1283 RepID=UPI002903D67C|nr:YbfB/YjiJ family MFS transporter [Staphylococcus haemolyticus]MDU0422283.1 YbfB/YjiJ family MFS transporter [Staphylococcus haemolyticus]MDU0438772.1 YbfB/YjiJ family MFS transporter [Staphylococcus haemolyticus]MDU0441258.1 YbfB/YjiJ family MFS transporter [Staphylococcus haemolyticus]MDU0443578.1 YbfB/YjiJ family MFS transporter [Staphylococcus haemolyticus]MDU0448162.1 YbfB/YjiJ family MFS transporter [Staphylococcus haemolyticus]